MSGKDCGIHGQEDQKRSCLRLLAILLALAVLTGVATLIAVLVLRPTRPRFYLKDATLRQLAFSNTSSRLTTILQATIAAGNPNARVGVLYTRLDAYATYRFQQITFISPLTTPVFQGRGDVDVWSPVLLGPGVPFAPTLAAALAQDIQAGCVALQVRVDGRVRWKVGSWLSGHYHMFVRCSAFFVSRGGTGRLGAFGLRFAGPMACRVDI